MIEVIIRRKDLFKIVDVTAYTGLDLKKFLDAYAERDDYIIEFRRTND